MSKLKVFIKAVGNTVFYSVLEQDESLRTISTTPLRRHVGEFNIVSSYCPDIEDDTVYLRGGDKTADVNGHRLCFKSPAEAQAYVARAKAALKEFGETGYFEGTVTAAANEDIVEV